MHLYEPDAPPRPPLREQLAVFSRPKGEADRVPEALVSTVRSLDEPPTTPDHDVDEEVVQPGLSWAERLPFVGRMFSRRVELDPEMKAMLEDMSRKAEEDQGSDMVDEGRLLLSIDRSRGLYAIPTTTGQVWVYLLEGPPSGLGGGHLVRNLPDGIDWQIHYRRDPDGGTRWSAFGLLMNDVEGVDLEFAEVSVAAQMGANSFFIEGEGDPSGIIAFVLHLGDGSVRRLTTEP
jgi:hypothetical protein